MKSNEGLVELVHRRGNRIARKARRTAQIAGLRGSVELIEGPPPNVPYDQFVALCEQTLGSPLESVRHQHTSGWKSSGAYRMVLTADDGSARDVFCKVNDHRPEEIAALLDFPASVGPAELAVLKAGANSPLRDHVPELCSFAHLEQSRSIILMEALGPRWQPCTSWSRDLAVAAAEAGTIQGLLRDRFAQASHPDLIRYGRDFSEELNDYARRKLTQLVESTAEEATVSALARWSELTRLYMPAAGMGDTPTVVHGDFNPANVLLHLSRRRVKVIDWEWAGIGDGYRDLAGLLKRAPQNVEHRALLAYHRVVGGTPDWPRYERCQLERGMLDAAFLSAQLVEGAHPPRMDMAGFIQSSLRRMFQAANALAT